MKHKTNKEKIVMQWSTLLIISLAYTATTINIQGFVALLPLVVKEFKISMAQAGLYSSFYFLSATLMSIFVGRIIDRIEAKRGMVLGVSAVGLMMIIHSFAPFFGIILFLAFFTGIGFSFITPSVSKAVMEITEPSRRGLSMGIAHSGGSLGASMGAMLLPFIGNMFGWRPAVLYVGVFSIFIGLFIYVFYRTRGKKVDTPLEDRSFSAFKKDLFFFLRHRYFLSISIMGFVMGISASSIGGHYALYLSHDLAYTPVFAGLGLAILYIGNIIGQPSWGLIIESMFRGDRRRGLFFIGLLVAGFTMFFGFFVGQITFHHYVILLFSFLLGFCSAGFVANYFTAVGELVTKDKVGLITGIALIFTRIGFILAPPLFGLVADISGTYSLSWILLGAAVLLLSFASFYLSGKFASRE